MNEPLAAINKTLAALEIIFDAPLWPYRAGLETKEADELYDAIIRDAKSLSLLIVAENFKEAMAVVAKWPVDAAIESCLVAENKDMQNLLAVYKYYVDAIGMNLTLINK